MVMLGLITMPVKCETVVTYERDPCRSQARGYTMHVHYDDENLGF
jgi:hypothetical protein